MVKCLQDIAVIETKLTHFFLFFSEELKFQFNKLTRSRQPAQSSGVTGTVKCPSVILLTVV